MGGVGFARVVDKQELYREKDAFWSYFQKEMEEFKLTQVARLEKLQNLFFWLFFTLLYTYTTFRKVTSIATPILYFNVPPYYHCLPAGVLRWLFLCTKNVFSGNGCMSPYYCPVIHHGM